MLRVLALGALVAGLAVAPPAQGSRAVTLSIEVSFFPDGTITVTLPDGTPVGTTNGAPTVIPAGAYTVVMSGPGGCTQLPLFTLKGPNTNIVSDMSGGEIDASTTNAYFAPNSTFTWRTDRGVSAVTHTFVTSSTVLGTAGGAGSSSGGSGGTAPKSEDIVGSAIAPLRGTLTGAVSASGALTVTFKGKRVKSLKAGRYTITVTDRSAKSGFMLDKGTGTPVSVTGAAFVGKQTKTVRLVAGRWVFTPGLHGKTTTVVVG